MGSVAHAPACAAPSPTSASCSPFTDGDGMTTTPAHLSSTYGAPRARVAYSLEEDSEPCSEGALHRVSMPGNGRSRARENGGGDDEVSDGGEDWETTKEGDREGGEERGVRRVMVIVRTEKGGSRHRPRGLHVRCAVWGFHP